MPVPDSVEPHGDGKKKSLHKQIDRVEEKLQIAGLELPGVTGALYLWRKLGWKGAVLMMLFVGFPVGQYSALRYAVYSALPRTVGGFGLDFEAEEWSLAPFSMRAVARNVSVAAPHDDKAVFTASEVQFQGSAWTLLRGLPDMLTFHLFGGPQPFNEIVIRNGELHLERSLTGRLNWADFVEAIPQARFEEALAGVYRINNLRVEDFRVSYVEHMPGGSGDGLIRTVQAQIKMDEITGTLSDLRPPEKPGERPTRFKINGRSADGVVQVAGTAALFPLEGESRVASDDPLRRVSNDGARASTAYPYEMSVYLENIAAAAYGRMVPVTTIVPVNGIIAGNTTIVYTGAEPTCQGSFTMTNVKFVPNPLVLNDPDDLEVVRRAVAATPPYSGPYALCDATDLTTSAGQLQQPAGLVLTDFTRQATRSASPAVRAIVERDNRTMRGETVGASLDQLTAGLAREMGLRVVGSVNARAGEVARQSLSNGSGTGPATAGSGNALTSGARSIGSGIKRLFGGGRKDARKKTGR
jgi:hypothetical protein